MWKFLNCAYGLVGLKTKQVSICTQSKSLKKLRVWMLKAFLQKRCQFRHKTQLHHLLLLCCFTNSSCVTPTCRSQTLQDMSIFKNRDTIFRGHALRREFQRQHSFRWRVVFRGGPVTGGLQQPDEMWHWRDVPRNAARTARVLTRGKLGWLGHKPEALLLHADIHASIFLFYRSLRHQSCTC